MVECLTISIEDVKCKTTNQIIDSFNLTMCNILRFKNFGLKVWLQHLTWWHIYLILRTFLVSSSHLLCFPSHLRVNYQHSWHSQTWPLQLWYNNVHYWPSDHLNMIVTNKNLYLEMWAYFSSFFFISINFSQHFAFTDLKSDFLTADEPF